jgi:NAD+ kinase
MRTVGVVVNPVAGMGGRVGLKGTDGKVEKARERGAEPRAPDRARRALEAMAATGEPLQVLTYTGVMGADAAREAGLDPEVVGEPEAGADAGVGETTAGDTRDAVRRFVEDGVDVVLFVGGDGTAADVAETLAGMDDETPIFGVPAGVKVYSSVFGVSPAAAGRVAATFEETERAEVNDIDEDDYRAGEVRTELRAVARVPVAEERQASKQLTGGSVEGLAAGFVEEMEPGVTYVLGPGSTLGEIKERLGVDGTALGVDVYRDGEVRAQDAAESDILESLGEDNVVVVSPVGGQGFVLGRGNQQVSPAVLRRSELVVVASRAKLGDVGALRVDTGAPDLDEQLRGWRRVRVGRFETRLVEVI